MNARISKIGFGYFFYKLMNNAFYGKILENVRNRPDIKIVTRKEKCELMQGKAGYKRTIFLEDVTAVHFRKTEIKFDKFVGFDK